MQRLMKDHQNDSPALSTRAAWTRMFVVLLLEECASHASFFHWNLGFGVIFLAYVWMPKSRWVLLSIGLILLFAITSPLEIEGMDRVPGYFLGYWRSPWQFVIANILPTVCAMAGASILHARLPKLSERVGTAHIQSLLLAAVVSSALVAAKDIAYVIDDGQIGDIRANKIVHMVPLSSVNATQLVGQFALDHFVGAFVGILLLAPLCLWWIKRNGLTNNRQILRDGFLFLIPIAVLYLAVSSTSLDTRLSESLRLLLFASATLFALRWGWRGASLAFVAASLMIALQDLWGMQSVYPILSQAFLAIAGATALTLGAAIDQNAETSSALARLANARERLRVELATAASGNLGAEERERKRIASELHDEFAQTLTAMQTQLSLHDEVLKRAELSTLQHSLHGLITGMRGNLQDVLERLRPVALDKLGLYGAIDRGSPRQLANDAGLEMTVQFDGDARLFNHLDDMLKIAAYRMSQEAITNVVRHAHAKSVRVRIRLSARSGQLWLFLDIRDDGRGGAGIPIRGRGLTNMQNRATTLNGKLYVSEAEPGIRLHALLRQASPS